MDRLEIDSAQVRRLVAEQFPQWADLPIRPVARSGWDNRTFHLGDAMTVRLPSAAGYVGAVEKEHRWLPVLARELPLPIPAPLAQGRPGPEYPFPWSVYGWIEGSTALDAEPRDPVEFARDVAEFLRAVQRVDATGGPQPGQHNWFRGGPLQYYDDQTRRALHELDGRIDVDRARGLWDSALEATIDGPDVWFHGDVAPGNLLLRDGRLCAVIDFGTCGVGDPSCDLAIAWNVFRGPARDTFREVLAADDALWARGIGWALWKALITYQDSSAVVEEILAQNA